MVELLVTLTISIIVVSSVLVRFDVFDSVVVLKSLAYELSVTVRQAQVYAVSAAGDIAGTANFNVPYGVYVDRVTSPKDYIFFEDSNSNGRYDAGADTDIEIYTIHEKYQVQDICVNGVCNTSVNSVSLVFQRPNFDPIIYELPDAGQPGTIGIQLALVDAASTTVTVEVGSTGHISVVSP